MSWTARQTALLEAIGLGSWPAMEGSDDAAPARAEAAAGEARQVADETEAPVRDARAAPAPAPAQALARSETVLERSTTAAASAPPTEAAAAPPQWADLDSLHAAVRSCRACTLCERRRQAVPGVGHARAEWMVVGEAPGEQEDAVGEPFVGVSGQLLDEMLAATGRGRQAGPPQRQVFIANTVKCRPPGNRNPTPEEIAACGGFLQAQIALVQPKLILALGRFAAQALLRDDSPVGRLRGRVHALPDGTPVVVSYHPSYLLRQPLEKARAWEDLCLALDAMDAMDARVGSA